MEDIREMRERHAREIQAFQDACEHKESRWLPYEWAPGHISDEKHLVCCRCDKHLGTRKPKTLMQVFAEEEQQNQGETTDG